MEETGSKYGMKAKNIKGRIHNKINNWLGTIKNEVLRAKLKEGVIVTGGAIASMLLGEEVNDFDIYFRNHDLTKAVAEYYLAEFLKKHKPSGGIKVPFSISDIDGRVKVVVKSAGIASAEGTDKPYQYFEGQPDESAAAYVRDVINDPVQIEDTYQEI